MSTAFWCWICFEKPSSKQWQSSFVSSSSSSRFEPAVKRTHSKRARKMAILDPNTVLLFTDSVGSGEGFDWIDCTRLLCLDPNGNRMLLLHWNVFRLDWANHSCSPLYSQPHQLHGTTVKDVDCLPNNFLLVQHENHEASVYELICETERARLRRVHWTGVPDGVPKSAIHFFDDKFWFFYAFDGPSFVRCFDVAAQTTDRIPLTPLPTAMLERTFWVRSIDPRPLICFRRWRARVLGSAAEFTRFFATPTD
jgi:hypothetical protein